MYCILREILDSVFFFQLVFAELIRIFYLFQYLPSPTSLIKLTLLIIIYPKSHSVNILYQSSSLQYYYSIKLHGQKYCDIWFWWPVRANMKSSCGEYCEKYRVAWYGLKNQKSVQYLPYHPSHIILRDACMKCKIYQFKVWCF